MQPIPYSPSGPPITYMPLQFRDKDAIHDSVECLALVHVDDLSCPFLIHQCSNLVAEGHSFFRHDFHTGNPCWPLPANSLFAMSLNVIFRRTFFMTLPSTDVRLTGLQFPGSSLFPFIQKGVLFHFLQSALASQDCQHL